MNLTDEEAFFGELYLRTTMPFLSEEVTAAEVDYLARAFHGSHPGSPILDLGCGHGRHAGLLAGRLGRPVVGLELDPLSLRQRRPGFLPVRGDLRSLPLQTASVCGAYAWYSTLFIFSDPENAQVLAEVARVLRPGGLLVFHTVPYERLLARPEAGFEHTLPDGSRIVERSRFDPRSGLDRGERTLQCPDGSVLSGTYAIRYHPRPDLERLFGSAGLQVLWAHGGLGGERAAPDSAELIIGAERI